MAEFDAGDGGGGYGNSGTGMIMPGFALGSKASIHEMLTTNVFNRCGIYTKEQIAYAKFHQYSRFGRMMDLHGAMHDTREYLFFVKPDLHILDVVTGELNPELENSEYFVDLVDKYPDVARQLQRTGVDGSPFSHLLSFGVNSSLDLPSISANTIDNSKNLFGMGFDYPGNAEESDSNPTFSLEFIDNRYLDIYHFFKAYQEYHIYRKYNTVYPPSKQEYTYKKKLHNVMGIFKFLVHEDMESIIHYSYIWGAYPKSAPRESFSDPAFSEGLTFSVDFGGFFVSDMNPAILGHFNELMSPYVDRRSRPIPLMSTDELYKNNAGVYVPVTGGLQLDTTLPTAALVVNPHNGGKQYKLLWY